MEKRRESGITLLEMVIATSIVVVVLAVAYPGFKVANDTMATSGTKDRIERAGDALLKTAVEELRAGLVIDLSPPGGPPSITISRPMRGVRLKDLPSQGETPWLSEKRTLRFRQEETVGEYHEGEDLNGDGDRHDYFAIGVLELDDGKTSRPLLTRAKVILGLPSYQDDVDGDGDADPLFTVVERTAAIRIHLVSRDAQGRWVRSVARCSVHLRNPQE